MLRGHSSEANTANKKRRVEEQLPELPDEIWKVIFYYLPIKDLNQIGSLNRTSNTLINEVKNEEYDSLWAKFQTNESPHSTATNLHSMYKELYEHTPYSLEIKRILLHYRKSFINKPINHFIIELFALMCFHDMPLPVKYICKEVGNRGFREIKSLALAYAVRYGDRDAFDNILRDNNIFRGQSSESIDSPELFNKNDAFKIAAEKGHLDMVNVILRYRPMPTNLGEALCCAVGNGFAEIVEVLLAIPQITDIPFFTQYYAFGYASRNNDDVILEKLFDRFSHSCEKMLIKKANANIELDKMCLEDNWHIHIEKLSANVDIVDKILSKDNLHISEETKVRCFSDAVKMNNHAVLERLLRYFPISEHQKTLLRGEAEMKGYAEIVALLSDSPAQTPDLPPPSVTYAFNTHTPMKTEDPAVEPSFFLRRMAM